VGTVPALRAVRRSRHRPSSVLRAGTVGCVVVLVGVSLRLPWAVPWTAVPGLALLAMTPSMSVELRVRRRRWTFTATDAALATALVLGGGGWVAPALLAGAALARSRPRRSRVHFEYDLSALAAAAALAALAAATFGEVSGADSAVGAGLGMAVYWLVRHLALALAVAVTANRRLLRLLTSRAGAGLLECAGSASVGLLAGWLAGNAPYGLLGLVVPLVALSTVQNNAVRRSTKARLFAELARGRQETSGRSVDSSVEAVVIAAARLLGGADIELLLIATDDPVRYLGNEYGVSERTRVPPSAFDAPWVLPALGAARVGTGCADDRPCCSVLIGGRDRPIAVLVARRPPGSAAFRRQDADTVILLADQAASWLTGPGQVGGDRAVSSAQPGDAIDHRLGEPSDPVAAAQLVLNTCAARLARLSTTAVAGERIAEIVEELYATERAVAVLVGTIARPCHGGQPALAPAGLAQPALMAATLDPVGGTRGSDWTTTGALLPVDGD